MSEWVSNAAWCGLLRIRHSGSVSYNTVELNADVAVFQFRLKWCLKECLENFFKMFMEIIHKFVQELLRWFSDKFPMIFYLGNLQWVSPRLVPKTVPWIFSRSSWCSSCFSIIYIERFIEGFLQEIFQYFCHFFLASLTHKKYLVRLFLLWVPTLSIIA